MQPTDPNKFTDKAWDAIVKSQDIARSYLQQQLDVEHLVLALLEPNELGDRILNKAGIELSRFQQQLDAFTQRQPKIGKSEQLYLGRNLDLLLDRAEAARAKMEDEFISIEHILLGFAQDDRIGRRLYKTFNLDTAKLESAIQAVRGSQKVTDQTPESRYQALEKFGRDLTEQAKTGKLDPVIGRNKEIQEACEILARRTKRTRLSYTSS